MNISIRRSGFLSLLLLLGLAGLAGCATPTNPDTVAKIASAAKIAAYVGTKEYLGQHPEKKSDFLIARDALLVIETSEHVDLAALLKIVNQLPVKELKSPDAVLIITASTILLTDYTKQLPVDQLDNLKPVAAAIREGIDLGLN